ncbi:hypothetical protein PanWU01x14_236100, partial [Parasponia andersonii]
QRSTPYHRQSVPEGTIVSPKGPECSQRNQSVPEGTISHIWMLARHTLFTSTRRAIQIHHALMSHARLT